MLSSPIAVIGSGLLLGVVHAFDPDHVVTLSTISSEKPDIRRTLRYCFSWAMGHGFVLLACGLCLFGLGFKLPELLQQSAEVSVGFLLIGLGLFGLWKLHHRVHSKSKGSSSGFRERKWYFTALIGMLHGLAGSAAALALVPVVSQQLSSALFYLLVFSLGVMLAMLVFGLGFSLSLCKLQRSYYRMVHINQGVMASGSVLLGGYWLLQFT